MPCLGSSPHLGVNILIQQMLWSHHLWPERYPMVWKIWFTVIDQFAGSSFQDNPRKENHRSPPFVYICTYVCMYACMYACTYVHIYIYRERERVYRCLHPKLSELKNSQRILSHHIPSMLDFLLILPRLF